VFSEAVKEHAHQHHSPSHWNNSDEPLWEWHNPNDLKPQVAVSWDGVPLVLHLPNAIHSRGKVLFYFTQYLHLLTRRSFQISLFNLLCLFGQNAKLTQGKGADGKNQNKKDSYKVVCGQLAGNIKLVSAWHAVGHTVSCISNIQVYLMTLPCPA
jgi:hypothetical protein